MGVIRLAEIDDCQAIIDFIGREWKSDHILCRDRDFFLYQYQDGNRLNFIISLDGNNQVNGILGFIKSSSMSEPPAWASLWKVSAKNGNAMLGMQLMETLRNMFPSRLFCSGINEKTIPLYKYLGIYTGTLEVFVMVNTQLEKFSMAAINKAIPAPFFIEDKAYSLLPMADNFKYDFKNLKNHVPYKDESYFLKRYVHHPIYTYIFYGIYRKEVLISIIVARSQCLEEAKALRIVDFIGNENDLKYVSEALYHLMVNNQYEYIDFVCYGFEKEAILQANFIEVDLDSEELIIPNYFSPYVKKNIKINFFADCGAQELVKICKADGDQDRPS